MSLTRSVLLFHFKFFDFLAMLVLIVTEYVWTPGGLFHKAIRKVTHDFTNKLYMKCQIGCPIVFSDVSNNRN